MVEHADPNEFDPSDADMDAFAEEFDRLAFEDDGRTAREILASGRPIPIARDDTPAGWVILLHPDGREELVEVDMEAAAALLGR